MDGTTAPSGRTRVRRMGSGAPMTRRRSTRSWHGPSASRMLRTLEGGPDATNRFKPEPA